MRKIIICSLLFTCYYLSAQTSTSRVVYHAKHNFGSSKVFNGKNTLHFDKDHTLFLHNNYPLGNETIEEGYTFDLKIGDIERLPIFISYKDSVSYSKNTLYFYTYAITIIKEKLDTISWEIESKQKKIKGYNCMNAFTTYEGRTYEVWFTPDIPVSFGPYRLRGLPGLILEARSVDGKVAWEFVGYEANTTEPVALKIPTNGDLYTWDEFVEARINYKYKKESLSDETGTIKVTDPNPSFFIEKGKFSIFEKYLKK